MQIIRTFFQPKIRHLHNALTWGAMIDPYTIITRNGEFMRCWQYYPRDVSGSTAHQLKAARWAMNLAVKQFGKGWGMWFECQRNKYNGVHAQLDNSLASRINHKRSRIFLNKDHYISSYFNTIIFSPKEGGITNLSHHFESDDGKSLYHKSLNTFNDGCKSFEGGFGASHGSIIKLENSSLLSYLKSCISTVRQNVNVPLLPCFLSEYLTDEDFHGGYYPRLGDQHVRIIRVKSSPDESYPGITDALNYLEFPYRNVTRWLPYDAESAKREISKRRKSWEAQALSLIFQIISSMIPEDKKQDAERKKITENPTSQERVKEANEAILAADISDFSFGLWSQNIIVTDSSIIDVDEKAQKIMQILRSKGFVCGIARGDSMSAYMGATPGLPHSDLNRLLTSSLSFCDMLPATAVWTGPEKDHHLNDEPLIRCVTEGKTPFNLCLHQPGSDVGHFLVLGRTGAGKSTLLGSMIAAHKKYKNSKQIIIDRDASAKCVALGLGGQFFSLGGDDKNVSLQPLLHIDKEQEIAWANEWIIGILEQERLLVNSQQKIEIYSALENLATKPERLRTLGLFRSLVQDLDVKKAISPFCRGGMHGVLLDNNEEKLTITDTTCFETSSLMYRTSAIAPVMSYIFHTIDRQLDGRPTLLVIDEAWAVLDHPMFRSKLREWLRTTRKKNCAVGLVTQSLSDIAGSAINNIVSESCLHRIYTANNKAMEESIAKTYKSFGLHDLQISQIASLFPKKEYISHCENGWRKFDLCLSDLELAFVGRNSPEDRLAMDTIKGDFVTGWLEFCDVKQFASAAE